MLHSTLLGGKSLKCIAIDGRNGGKGLRVSLRSCWRSLTVEVSLSTVETEGRGTASLPSLLLLVFLNHR